MSDENKKDEPKVQADNNSIAVGNISAGGNIGYINISTGYSVEQVSVLITQIQSTFQPKPFDGRCPYKGLDIFEEEDAELFFGREKLFTDLVSRVKESRTVFVTGPSGSGKSSLVRAGLIHALKQGAIKESHSERWLYETMKPGRDPIGELGRVASSLAGSTNAENEIHAKAIADATIFARWCEIALKEGRDRRVVLFIDQFEEVFTQISNETERVTFLNLLTHAATVENGRAIILFSMRSDFVSNCATYPQLNALLNQQFVQIGAMQPEELVSAIAQPALRVGLRIDPDLISQIINEMRGEPGALPLMQFALKDLFDSQQEKSDVIALTLNDYLQRGGIHKALERHADDSFSKLSKNEQELARSIFSGLIEIGRGTQDTRRTALFDELIPANTKAEDVEAIVQKLADARLVTTDEQAGKDTVTISHEKLIDAWPWLKKLVNENRDVIALQNEIASDAKEWEEHKRDASYLYTGARLFNAREQLDTKKLVLSGLAHEFVQAGYIRQQRGRLAFIAGISIIIALLVFAVIVFSHQSTINAETASIAQAASTEAIAQKATAQANAEEAQKQANISRARELTAQSTDLRNKNFSVSLLLSVEAFNTRDIIETRSALLANAQANPQLQTYLNGHIGPVTSVAFSPDGKMFASGSTDNTIVLWDTETHQPIGDPLTGHGGSVLSVAFSPEGNTLASGSADNTIILWNVKTHRRIGDPLIGHQSSVYSVAFNPDGKKLISGGCSNSENEGVCRGGEIIIWNVETRQQVGAPLFGHKDRVTSVAFSPDGNTFASGGFEYDNTILLWDVATHQPVGKPLTGHQDFIRSVVFDPVGKTLASSGNDGIILWNVETHQPIGETITGQNGSASSVAFSPNGKTLASSGNDGIILWDVATHKSIEKTFTGNSGAVISMAFSPDGKIIVSGGCSGEACMTGEIVLWDVETRPLIGEVLSGHGFYIRSLAFSPDGKILASGSDDDTLILWNTETHQSIGRPLNGHSGWVLCVTFSSDGKTLASGSTDGTIILWDANTHRPIGVPFTGHSGNVNSVAFSPDGKTLASGSDDNTIILWDVQTHQPIGKPFTGHSAWVNSVVFSPDGKTLTSGSNDNTIILWDVQTHQPIGKPFTGHSAWVRSVVFSPDGKILASGSEDETIMLWNVETHQPIGAPLTGHSDLVHSVVFSPDGKILASGSGDKTIILWDVKTHQPIGNPLTGHIGWVNSVAFNPLEDTSILASSSDDDTIILWDLDPQSWVEKSCKRAGRNFTRAEWAQYFPNEEYRKTCEQWLLESESVATPTATP